MGQSNSTVVRAFVLHAADLGSIPNASYDSPSLPRLIPDYRARNKS